MVDELFGACPIAMLVYDVEHPCMLPKGHEGAHKIQPPVGSSFNSRTPDSESGNLGANPREPANLEARLKILETRMTYISRDQRTCCDHLYYAAGAVGPGPVFSIGGFDVCKSCMEFGAGRYQDFLKRCEADA